MFYYCVEQEAKLRCRRRRILSKTRNLAKSCLSSYYFLEDLAETISFCHGFDSSWHSLV